MGFKNYIWKKACQRRIVNPITIPAKGYIKSRNMLSDLKWCLCQQPENMITCNPLSWPSDILVLEINPHI